MNGSVASVLREAAQHKLQCLNQSSGLGRLSLQPPPVRGLLAAHLPLVLHRVEELHLHQTCGGECACHHGM